MQKRILFVGIVIIVVAGFFFLKANDAGSPPEPILIFTQVPAMENPAAVDDNLLPDFNGSRIVRLNYENANEVPEVLTPDFYSAATPSLSFDNERIVFSGKENKDDPWQIWLMDLDGSDKEKVFESTDNSLTPAFLPTGDIVFSREMNDPKIGVSYSLFTVGVDGEGLNRITFHPHRDLHTSMLHDGRIAMVSQQVYPETKRPVFMVLRPDGTKAQSFYHDKSKSQIKSPVRETADGRLIFVQGREDVDELVSLPYANPNLPPNVIASYPANGIQSVDILESGGLVVSSRSTDGVFAIHAVNIEGEEELIYENDDYHSVEPVAARSRKMPRKLPSSISNEEGSGIIISQNVNQSQIEIDGDPETKYIRVEGIDRTLQELAVAEDGSFYLRVQSDMPIRFQSLDENKDVLRGPSSWIWLRTNERRACVGCHENKTIAPANLVPQAIYEDPVMITDTTRMIEASEVQAVRQILNEKMN